MPRIVHVAILVDLLNEDVSDGVSELLSGGPDWIRDWSYAPADMVRSPSLAAPGQYYAIGDDYEEGEFDAVAWPEPPEVHLGG